LSPPWGGTKYKESDVYNIKELITPNIYDIIKVSLNISRNIIFYLPRTLLLEELFEILSTILNLQDTGKGNRIFLDVHILKSEKKIKALLIIFGHDINEVKLISIILPNIYNIDRLNQATSQNILITTIPTSHSGTSKFSQRSVKLWVIINFYKQNFI